MSEFIAFLLDMNLSRYLSVSALLFCFQAMTVKRLTVNFLDPLFLFCFLNSCAIAVVVEHGFMNENLSHAIYVILFMIFFYFGALVFNHDVKKDELNFYFFNFFSNAFFFFSTLFIILLISSLIFWLVRGVPIFSENPSDSKVSLYQGGFGIVRYIQTIIPPMLSFYAIHQLCFIDIKSKFRMYCLKLFVFFSAGVVVSVGSKSSVIFYIFILSYIINLLPLDSRLKKKLWIYICFILIFLLFFVAIILYKSNAAGDYGQVLNQFSIRLAAGGDAYFLWFNYHLDEKLSNFDFWGFIMYIINPPLSMIGLVEPNAPIGAVILYESVGFPISSFGPNSSLPIVASYFFNGFEYLISFFCGALFSFFRTRIIFGFKRFGALGGGFVFTCWMCATSLFVDINYFTSVIASFFYVIIPVYFFSRLFFLAVAKTNWIQY